MKKAVILCCFIFACAGLDAAQWWLGGPARALALGRVEIALPDSTNVIDLYSDGYGSAIFSREKFNLISISPAVAIINAGANSDYRSDFFSFYSTDENSNMVSYWFSADDVVIFKPLFYASSWNMQPFNENVTMNILSGEAQYCRRLNDSFSLAAMLGYSVLNGSDSLLAARAWKLEYLVDATFKVAEGIDISLSGGYKRKPLRYSPLEPGFAGLVSAFSVCSKYLGFSGYEDDPADLTGSYRMEYKTGGTNLNIGLQVSEEKLFKLAISAGAIVNSSFELHYPGYTAGIQKGTGYNGDLKFRYYAGDNLIFAAAAEADLDLYKYSTMPVDTEDLKHYNINACAGMTFYTGPLKVPAELFWFNTGEDVLFSKYGGVRGGVEYGITQEIDIRCGVNYPFFIEHEPYYSSLMDVEGTFGIGYRNGSFIAGLGAGYSFKRQVDDDGLYVESKILDIAADLKIIF